MLISWLIMNLSIAAVIEGLENAKLQNFGVINADHCTSLMEAWMEYDPSASGWIKITDFICLLIELPHPFGNEELRNMCQFFTPEDFEINKDRIYKQGSYLVNEKKRFILKKKNILNELKNHYKIQTYTDKVDYLHFKDIY